MSEKQPYEALPTWCGRAPGDPCYWLASGLSAPCDTHPARAPETLESRLAAFRSSLAHPAGPGRHA